MTVGQSYRIRPEGFASVEYGGKSKLWRHGSSHIGTFVSYDGVNLTFHVKATNGRNQPCKTLRVSKYEVSVSEVFDPNEYALNRQKIRERRRAGSKGAVK